MNVPTSKYFVCAILPATRYFRVACLVLTSVAASPCSHGQNASNSGFEVASVRASAPEKSQSSIRRWDVGSVVLDSTTVKEVLLLCFHIRPYQVSGGPDWLAKKRFDFAGKNPSATMTSSPNDAKARTAGLVANDENFVKLLRDRFSLVFHHEQRRTNGFVLFHTKDTQFTSVPCSSSYRLQKGWVDGNIRIQSLVALLKADMDMPVEDQTGLPDCYRMQTRWTNDPNDDSALQISTALRDMGLQLRKAKVDVDVIVIDHAELPTTD